jgi:hypothetical protein
MRGYPRAIEACTRGGRKRQSIAPLWYQRDCGKGEAPGLAAIVQQLVPQSDRDRIGL